MRARLLVALVASFVSLSACGQGEADRSGSARNGHAQGSAGSVERVRDAAVALRRAGTATVSGTAVLSFTDSGIERRKRSEQEGTYQADGGPWGATVHTSFTEYAIEPVDETVDSTSWDKATLDWWHLGEVSLLSHGGANASPLTGLVFVDRATEARSDGTERKDGVRLTRWKITVPAEAAYELLGHRGGSGTPDLLAIDCAAGLPMTVWIDDQGRFRGFRLVTEYYDGDRFDAEFSFADLGRPVPTDIPPPPQHWIDGVAELQDRERDGQEPEHAPTPCAGSRGTPMGVDRSGCSPASLEGFVAIDKLGRYSPGAAGTAGYSFKEPVAAREAFDGAAGLAVVGFWTRYIGPGGWELSRSAHEIPSALDPADQAAVRDLLSRPEDGELAPTDVRLYGITLKGTWAELAAEASDCRYERASR